MRQTGMSQNDIAFRVALGNMRYAQCTAKDVALLRTRVYAPSGPSFVTSLAGYEDVAIITARNAHRDAINIDGAERFAERAGKPLHYFHSRDMWGKVKDSLSIRQAQKLYSAIDDPIRRGNVIGRRLQKALWALRPAMTDHLAGILALCEGMPVLLKANEATELGATNGAAGVVHGWSAHSDSAGREYLDVLFVRLLHPPKPFQLSGLDENVVPITPCRRSVTCKLPVGKITITIQRDQPACLQNFAISDFTSQGLTRTRNVVHPRHCRNHQSLYTVLSRSSSLNDTIILEGIDAAKIQSGASSALLQEFRDLEILDEITSQRESSTLSLSVAGSTRAELISSFLALQEPNYVPPRADSALPWDCFDRSYPSASSLVVTDRPTNNSRCKRSAPVAEWTVASISNKRPRLSPDIEVRSPPRIGLRWDAMDWSCAYDSVLTIVWNLKVDLGNAWLQSLHSLSVASALLVTRFVALPTEAVALEPVRNTLRDLLSMMDPTAFPRKGETMASVSDLALALFHCSAPCGVSEALCTICHTCFSHPTDLCTSYVWTVLPDIVRRVPSERAMVPMQAVIDILISAGYPVRCRACRNACDVTSTFHTAPPIVCIDVGNVDGLRADDTLHFPVAGADTCWKLRGVIYHGFQHFTARYIAEDDSVWYHDGASTGQYCIREAGTTRELDLFVARNRRACHYLYTQVDAR
ncbi:hypothetical protein FKP32DRAFT_1577011 [Trametes sanguinea]|nr:hypothetical protein FKP32DRAFT_1577011 [Trametes sanguinea]